MLGLSLAILLIPLCFVAGRKLGVRVQTRHYLGQLILLPLNGNLGIFRSKLFTLTDYYFTGLTL